MGRAVALLVLVSSITLLTTPIAGARTATTRAQAIAIVQQILTRNTKTCHMVVKGIAAKAAGSGWHVTASVVTFGNRGQASWGVSAGGRATPAEPLAADIAGHCPG